MKSTGRCLYLLFFSLLPLLGVAADSIRVVDHTVLGVKAPTQTEPETIVIKLEVEYVLTSKPKADLVFLVDREKEMIFTLADQKEVLGQKKKKRVEVAATLTRFQRGTLRGMVLLMDPDLPVDSPPLAKTGISLDVKKFKRG